MNTSQLKSDLLMKLEDGGYLADSYGRIISRKIYEDNNIADLLKFMLSVRDERKGIAVFFNKRKICILIPLKYIDSGRSKRINEGTGLFIKTLDEIKPLQLYELLKHAKNTIQDTIQDFGGEFVEIYDSPQQCYSYIEKIEKNNAWAGLLLYEFALNEKAKVKLDGITGSDCLIKIQEPFSLYICSKYITASMDFNIIACIESDLVPDGKFKQLIEYVDNNCGADSKFNDFIFNAILTLNKAGNFSREIVDFSLKYNLYRVIIDQYKKGNILADDIPFEFKVKYGIELQAHQLVKYVENQKNRSNPDIIAKSFDKIANEDLGQVINELIKTNKKITIESIEAYLKMGSENQNVEDKHMLLLQIVNEDYRKKFLENNSWVIKNQYEKCKISLNNIPLEIKVKYGIEILPEELISFVRDERNHSRVDLIENSLNLIPDNKIVWTIDQMSIGNQKITQEAIITFLKTSFSKGYIEDKHLILLRSVNNEDERYNLIKSFAKNYFNKSQSKDVNAVTEAVLKDLNKYNLFNGSAKLRTFINELRSQYEDGGNKTKNTPDRDNFIQNKREKGIIGGNLGQNSRDFNIKEISSMKFFLAFLLIIGIFSVGYVTYYNIISDQETGDYSFITIEYNGTISNKTAGELNINDGIDLNMVVGESMIVTLYENKTSGYQWIIETTSGLEIQNETFFSIKNNTEGDWVERGYNWEIRAINPEIQQITAYYRNDKENIDKDKFYLNIEVSDS